MFRPLTIKTDWIKNFQNWTFSVIKVLTSKSKIFDFLNRNTPFYAFSVFRTCNKNFARFEFLKIIEAESFEVKLQILASLRLKTVIWLHVFVFLLPLF